MVAGPPSSVSGGSHQDKLSGAGLHRCKSLGLGCPFQRSSTPGPLVNVGETEEHQFPRAAGDLLSPTGIPPRPPEQECPRVYRQHHGEVLHQPSGGNEVPVPLQGSTTPVPLGGEQIGITAGRTRARRREHPGRLAEQAGSRPVGMVASQGQLRRNRHKVRPSRDRPVRDTSQQPVPKVLLEGEMPGVSGDRRTSAAVAEGSTVCLPSVQHTASSPQQDQRREGGGRVSGPSLAKKTLVRGAVGDVEGITVPASVASQSPNAGPNLPSGPRLPTVDGVEAERRSLAALGYSQAVLMTLTSDRRKSTNRVYNYTWRRFVNWCSEHGVPSSKPRVKHLLEFLQAGLDKGLSTATLRRQVSAIASILGFPRGRALSAHPHVRKFLRGATLLNPPTVHRVPTWDLPLVLKALTREPFEPMATSSLRDLTLKTVFLVGVVSTRRVSEIAALSAAKELCIFSEDSVTLRLDPTFLPKVNTLFHRTQEIILPSFCTNPVHVKEKQWHTLDVRRALSFYLSRTQAFRKTEALFIQFHGNKRGSRVFPHTISRWIREAIVSAYKARGVQAPEGIVAHSTRAAGASAAFKSHPSLEEVCRAATWISPNTFIKHYKVDQFASQQVSFARRILQAVVQEAAT